MVAADRLFAGSVPEIYDGFLVPLIFNSYASDLAERLAAVRPREVLETAAGTGVLTRAIASRLQGTPLRNEIEDRNPLGLEKATQASADALAKQFGTGPIQSRTRAHVITAIR